MPELELNSATTSKDELAGTDVSSLREPPAVWRARVLTGAASSRPALLLRSVAALIPRRHMASPCATKIVLCSQNLQCKHKNQILPVSATKNMRQKEAMTGRENARQRHMQHDTPLHGGGAGTLWPLTQNQRHAGTTSRNMYDASDLEWEAYASIYHNYSRQVRGRGHGQAKTALPTGRPI